MDDDIDVQSFWSGLLWGMVLILTLIRFEMWLRRPRPPAVADPFDTLRWDMHRSVREIIEGEWSDAA